MTTALACHFKNRAVTCALLVAVLVLSAPYVAYAQEETTLPVAVPDAEMTMPEEFLQNTNGTALPDPGIVVVAETNQPSATTKPSFAPGQLSGMMTITTFAGLIAVLISSLTM
eukprot:GDKJ01021942.1.p1 GENE.GDKJ01021942.1~~GDKJ01021942.1.p1  ORF type:complete len:113 (+),score=9.39 GDKJ01021942.1:70-408(+)